MISAVTGQQFQIGAGPYRATVTGLGAGLRELLFRGQPVIAGYDADELPPGGAGQLLAPWPNRIDGGRYVFGGAEFQLALTEPEHANAIHGLTRWTAWTPVRHEAGAVVLRSSPHGQEGSGAGDGNRTRMASLEGWGSAIELRPHELPCACGGPCAHR